MRAIALSLVVVAGCGAADPPLVGDDILAAPPPGQGVQLEMVSDVGAGDETERCRFFQVGEGGLWVGREETRYTPGSHHVLLFSTPYTGIPTRDHSGRDRDTRGIIECGDGAFADWDIDGVVGGAQSPTGGGDFQGPPGVALHLPPGAVVLMDVHYLNAWASPLKATARINLWSLPAADVTAEAGVLFFYDFYIHVPPFGRGSAEMRCPVRAPIQLVNAQSHMHARGVGYEANLVDEDGAIAMPLYDNASWSDVPVRTFDPPLALPSSSWIQYRCDYQETEGRDVVQGLTTKDEMCMFVGVYYPRDPRLERCALDDTFWTSDLAAVHVGQGTRACGDALACLDAATTDGARADCYGASCPQAANPLAAVLSCRMNRAGGACDGACATDPSPACAACLDDKCAAEIAACDASGC